jgi:serine/threonine protein kinase/outer membrane protein assembly factor BamB
MIGKTISHYKILEEVGKGGMGVVYKAEDTKLKRAVALKFLPQELLCDSEAKSRFIHEAQAASALNHPNITTIYEIDEVDQNCFISMEYVDGTSLEELIKQKSINLDDVLKFGEQIGEGLQEAHKKQVVHRDIKSDNIMITKEGKAKIMDFGLAKLKGASKLTKTGTTLGTLQYMSPEQAQGREVDRRSDIFSFGVVLYQMMSGQVPFKGEHEAAILYSIINERHTPLSQIIPTISPKFERIIDKALIKDRDKRYQSVDELLADLREFSATYQKTRFKPRKKEYEVIKALSVVALGALLLLGYFLFRPEKKTIPEKEYQAEQTQGAGGEKRKSLAVMYLENLSGGERTDLIRAGLFEGLRYNLGMISQLLVIPKKEILDFKDKHLDPREIVDSTGAKYILDGTVQMIGETIGLTMQILDPQTNSILWREKYACTNEKEVFEVQDKIALQIIDKLGIILTDEEKALYSKKDGINDKAQKLIERGLYYYDNKSYPLALESFKQALEEDKSYFRTHYYLGQTYQAMNRWKEAIREYQQAIPEAERFRRVSHSYQLFDSIPPDNYYAYIEDSTIYWTSYESRGKTTTLRCFDISKRALLSENEKKIEKGIVIPWGGESFRNLGSGRSSPLIDTIKNCHIYAINCAGELLWDFNDSSCNFVQVWSDGNFISAWDGKGAIRYILDANGKLLTKVKMSEYEELGFIADSCLLLNDRSTSIMRYIDLKEPSKIDTMIYQPYQHYIGWVKGNVILIDESTSRLEYRKRGHVKSAWSYYIPPTRKTNCLIWENSVICFSDSGDLYAIKQNKPFYSSRLKWKTHLGRPCTNQALGWCSDSLLLAITEDGTAYGLDFNKGNIKWSVKIGNRYNEPQVWWQSHSNFLVFQSSTEISAFNIETGTLKWTKSKQKASAPFVKKKNLFLVWNVENYLRGVDLKEGSILFSYHSTPGGRLFITGDHVFILDRPNDKWIKELNLDKYEQPGRMREDEILKEIGICYFQLKDYKKADSLFVYITRDLGIEDPDCYYHRYLVAKSIGNRESSFVALQNYFVLVKDIKNKERAAAWDFKNDFGISMINASSLPISLYSEYRISDADSTIYVAKVPYSDQWNSDFGFERYGYSLRPEERRISLFGVDKSTGLQVCEMSLPGVVSHIIIQNNLVLIENHNHDQSMSKVDFSVNAFDLSTKKVLWENHLIADAKASAYFSILKADSNYVWAYCDYQFWASDKEKKLDNDSTDLQFWLLQTTSGKILREKKVRLSNVNPFVLSDGENVLVASHKNVLIFDGVSLQQTGEIKTLDSITGVSGNEGKMYLGTIDDCYSAYDIKTGKSLWHFKMPYTLEDFSPGFAYVKDDAFLDWNWENLLCIDTKAGTPDNKRIKWRFQPNSICPGANISYPLDLHLDRDKLYVRLGNCKEFAYIILDWRTGRFIKGLALPWIDAYRGQVCISGNTIYCLTSGGIFYKVE